MTIPGFPKSVSTMAPRVMIWRIPVEPALCHWKPSLRQTPKMCSASQCESWAPVCAIALAEMTLKVRNCLNMSDSQSKQTSLARLRTQTVGQSETFASQGCLEGKQSGLDGSGRVPRSGATSPCFPLDFGDLGARRQLPESVFLRAPGVVSVELR